jgi:hypothetical protein
MDRTPDLKTKITSELEGVYGLWDRIPPEYRLVVFIKNSVPELAKFKIAKNCFSSSTSADSPPKICTCSSRRPCVSWPASWPRRRRRRREASLPYPASSSAKRSCCCCRLQENNKTTGSILWLKKPSKNCQKIVKKLSKNWRFRHKTLLPT